jgi:dephospho-CoA kinase
MLTIGLTGGIGSGKTAVADMFKELGVVVIDADVIAHLLVQPGTDALAEIVDTFGKTILTIDGELDRARLADIVFGKPELRKKLETIIHPRVRTQIRMQKQAHEKEPYILVVIPLLLESGQRDLVDRVLVVDAAESTRINRVKTRDGRSEQQIRSIMQNQADDAQRSAAADDRIDNNGPLDELRQRVDELHRKYSDMVQQDNFM